MSERSDEEKRAMETVGRTTREAAKKRIDAVGDKRDVEAEYRDELTVTDPLPEERRDDE